MLVGPTGVGKTTTIAKLAARFTYKSDIKYRVGIITVDSYRLGAVEQLMQYAKMMKLSIEIVEDPLDFSTAIASLKHCDYILIDTAGSSQHDNEKIVKLKQFLDVEMHMSIDVTLTIAATTKYEDMRDIYQNFSILGIDSIIATKMDETKGYGNLFSLIYDNKKPISYFSVGQEVPDDLIPATSNFFVDNILKPTHTETV
jgi:flagellar biosynthesis protein FlhF